MLCLLITMLCLLSATSARAQEHCEKEEAGSLVCSNNLGIALGGSMPIVQTAPWAVAGVRSG